MRSIYLLFFAVLFNFGFSQNKINGLSVVSSKNGMAPDQITYIKNVNANAVVISPFSFTRGLNNPDLTYNSYFQWQGERPAGVREMIQIFKQNGFTILLKPQIWVWGGKFCGHIQMDSKTDWTTFEEKYTEYILEFAKIAEEENVAIFSIGTELNNFVKLRPTYWHFLIQEVRKVYCGKLTYAANWDAYEQFKYWDQLDFIGIDQYFPLSDLANPSLSILETLWKPYVAKLKATSMQYGKPILFPEFGYRSIDYCTKEPWDFSKQYPLNMDAQSVALQAVFNSFWDEPWFAGGFLWKWFDNHESAGGIKHSGYTIQNKPAELIVQKHYLKYKL